MGKIIWNNYAAEKATFGKADSNWEATGISFDSRKTRKGDLFVALTGNRDGHDFLEMAFENGAVAAMVSKEPNKIISNGKFLFVDDVMKALVRMAIVKRNKSKAIFVGITGTSGKTSTKEMSGLVFNQYGRTHFSKDSFNNLLGCSLTLATLPDDAEYAIIEIGTNKLGEIGELSKLVKPDFVIITDVSVGHMEGLKTIDNVVLEKASICKWQKNKGVAIIPSGIEKFKKLKKQVIEFGSEVISCGEREFSDVRILEIYPMNSSLHTKILDQQKNIIEIKLKTVGKHYVKNACALIALIKHLKLNMLHATKTLKKWEPLAGRGEILRVQFTRKRRKVSINLIDESYNANPGSMKAALETLACISMENNIQVMGCRRIAVLGDMLELGSLEVKEHEAIIDFPKIDKIDKFYCIGSRMAWFFEKLPIDKKGFWTATVEEMNHVFVNILQNEDTVMVKGSFSMGMNKIINKLKNINNVEL